MGIDSLLHWWAALRCKISTTIIGMREEIKEGERERSAKLRDKKGEKREKRESKNCSVDRGKETERI